MIPRVGRRGDPASIVRGASKLDHGEGGEGRGGGRFRSALRSSLRAPPSQQAAPSSGHRSSSWRHGLTVLWVTLPFIRRDMRDVTARLWFRRSGLHCMAVPRRQKKRLQRGKRVARNLLSSHLTLWCAGSAPGCVLDLFVGRGNLKTRRQLTFFTPRGLPSGPPLSHPPLRLITIIRLERMTGP